MAPLLFEDMVIIAPAGSELGVKGWIGAFRLSTGTRIRLIGKAPQSSERAAAEAAHSLLPLRVTEMELLGEFSWIGCRKESG